MQSKIDSIVNRITASYEEIGGINHLEGPNLPSQESVIRIVHDFASLIFPGFHDETVIAQFNLKYFVGEKTAAIIRNLSVEVEKSLRFKERLAGASAAGANPQTAENVVLAVLETIPEIRRRIKLDVEAAFAGDPAAKSQEEAILAYPCLKAILVHRVAHEFWVRGVPLIPRMMSEYIHSLTGIDIHPGAKIGDCFFIDHGTGVVIGETTEIGNCVKLYQGVTLGALSVKKEMGNKKRHPTIQDHVTIYAHATILGGDTVIGHHAVIGGNVWLTSSVPPHSRVHYEPRHYIIQSGSESGDFQI